MAQNRKRSKTRTNTVSTSHTGYIFKNGRIEKDDMRLKLGEILPI